MHFIRPIMTQYATFSGRTSRKEFWLFSLWCFVFSFVTHFADVALGTYSDEFEIGVFSVLFGLAIMLPLLGMYVRRLHDMNKSGWWMWIGIIPLLGPVILLVLFCRASNTRSNRYGPTPDLVAVRGIRSA